MEMSTDLYATLARSQVTQHVLLIHSHGPSLRRALGRLAGLEIDWQE